MENEQDSEQKQTFGQWLFYQRKTLRKWSMEKLGQTMIPNYTKSHISNLEKGRQHGTSGADSQPSPEFCNALAVAFNMPASQVFAAAGLIEDQPPPPPEHKIQAIWNRYGRLAQPENIRLADNMIEALDRQIAEIEDRERESSEGGGVMQGPC